jgi:hypothetical protein
MTTHKTPIVLTASAVIMCLAFWCYQQYRLGCTAEAQTNECIVRSVAIGLEQYNLFRGAFPASLDVLMRDENGSRWVERTTDGWGNKIIWTNGAVVSLGSDNRAGGSGLASDVVVRVRFGKTLGVESH